jgi:hypothetical protein
VNRDQPKLESAVEGSGNCGVVVQGPLGGSTQPDEALTNKPPWRAIVPSHLEIIARVDPYPQGYHESCSLIVLYKVAGVLLRSLNIAPSPIANK